MKTMAEDYYKILGVERTASKDEIHKSYRKLARKYHPDMNPDDKAAKKKFQEIQKAFDVLGDAEKRKKYDQFGPAFENMGAGGAWTGGGGPMPFDLDQVLGGQGGGGFQFDGDIGDLFRQFTGGASPNQRTRSRTRGQPVKGNDVSAELTVPFNTAVLGGQASIVLQRGSKREAIQVTIPAGVDSGQKIRLRGQGEPSASGGASGDLIITLSVAAHPHFRRQGQNLELRLPVTVGEALLGAKVEVPTPSGTVEFKIPAGSSSGRRLRIKGQGVRDSKGSVGDLFVELSIILPARIDEKGREAVEVIERQYTQQLRDGLQW